MTHVCLCLSPPAPAGRLGSPFKDEGSRQQHHGRMQGSQTSRPSHRPLLGRDLQPPRNSHGGRWIVTESVTDLEGRGAISPSSDRRDRDQPLTSLTGGPTTPRGKRTDPQSHLEQGRHYLAPSISSKKHQATPSAGAPEKEKREGLLHQQVLPLTKNRVHATPPGQRRSPLYSTGLRVLPKTP